MDLYRYVQLGGPMMWPLLACSVLLGAVLFERLWTLGVVGGLLGVRLVERRRLWHRRGLAPFRDLPPSLGLLGTVVGVVQSFNLTGGPLDGESVGAGLAVACMTTIFGLSIALVASTAGYVLDAVADPGGVAIAAPDPHEKRR